MDSIVTESEKYVNELEKDFQNLGIDTEKLKAFKELYQTVNELKECKETDILKIRDIYGKYGELVSELVNRQLFIENFDSRLKSVLDKCASMGLKTKEGEAFIFLKRARKLLTTPEVNNSIEKYENVTGDINNKLESLENNIKKVKDLPKRVRSIEENYDHIGANAYTTPEFENVMENLYLVQKAFIDDKLVGKNLEVFKDLEERLDVLEIKHSLYNIIVANFINLDNNSRELGYEISNLPSRLLLFDYSRVLKEVLFEKRSFDKVKELDMANSLSRILSLLMDGCKDLGLDIYDFKATQNLLAYETILRLITKGEEPLSRIKVLLEDIEIVPNEIYVSMDKENTMDRILRERKEAYEFLLPNERNKGKLN